MRTALLLLLAVFAVPPGAALAQEASASVRETRCWVGNVSFSAGVGINAGNGIALCTGGSGWTQAEATTPVAGCLLEGKLSSSGAIVGIRNNDTMLLRCDPSGRWVTMDAEAKD